MRIVIDFQGAQSSGSRDRGIGRYTLSLTQAIIRNKGEHEIIIALNGLFPDTIEPIRAAFNDLLPQENIRVWYAPGPVTHIDSDNNWRRNTAELVREAFLANLQPDLVYVTSLFEGANDDAVTSIGRLTPSIPTAVTLYDLIPLINRKPYLDDPLVESWYENKLHQLRKASLLLAISESARQECIEYIGFPDAGIIKIGTSADPQFQCIDISNTRKEFISELYGLLYPFVLYTGGIDHRKNVEGLIRAYALVPQSLREKHQLVIVCSVEREARLRLEELVAQQGMASEEVILTGFVPESDLIALYNLCKVFIFPSWHEGFGLPALEAMCCGAAVIAANTSSMPEVLQREDALFNPHDDRDMAQKIQQVLTDEAYRAELIQHSLAQAKKFCWDKSAKLAINAFERLHLENSEMQMLCSRPVSRPKLAFVSPLPPERTGIANYSAELLSELLRYYDIDVIVEQEAITTPWIKENCLVRTARWFSNHGHLYDRVLYQFGNSSYHQHMFDLLRRIPGVVVLHDFFLGHITVHMDGIEDQDYSNFLTKTLYHSHGYQAVHARFLADNIWDMAWKYPCNKTVIDGAQAVIVHSDQSKRLAQQWYGDSLADNWSVIPLLRIPARRPDCRQARNLLDIRLDAFVVSSFGRIGQAKQNQRLLEAWLASPLSKDERCLLIFIGENDTGNYGEELTATILESGLSHRIRITGWVEDLQFRHYLAATDVAVQLRTLSRGETSAAVLDCMSYGLATIVNANGSMADLPKDAVCMLPDEFETTALSTAIEHLWQEATYRNNLGKTARETIRVRHSPRDCADQYFHVIEKYARSAKASCGENRLALAIAQIADAPHDERDFLYLAEKIAQNQGMPSGKQFLLDISVLVRFDSKSGIQRVVRSLLSELLTNPPSGFRVEPVYAKPFQGGYFYARKFALRFLECPDHPLEDEPVETYSGDIFLALDCGYHVVEQQANFYSHIREIGGKVYFIVYDLLPVLIPDDFPKGTDTLHKKWLTVLAKADGVVCISRAVAHELIEWLNFFGPNRLLPLKVGWFHLGADIAGSIPTTGLPDNSDNVLKELFSRPTFLMVGTIESRKGYKQTLAAFDLLWKQGNDVNLVLVGRRGWKVVPLLERLNLHPENNRRLFWLDSISDEYLEKIYDAASCLIAASEGEGFGLPLIEAAQHNLPIIARDIPVFREVMGEHGFYFAGVTPNALADRVCEWLVLEKTGQAPKSSAMPWLTWKQSTQNLLDVVIGGLWYKQWILSGDTHRFDGSDSRLQTEVGKRIGNDMVSEGRAGHLIFGPYISLAANHYRVVICGTLGENGLQGARMEVTVNQGNHIIGRSALNEPDDNGILVMLTITLVVPCNDLEIRVWVNDDTDLQISMIEIAPWQGEQETVSIESASHQQGAQLLSYAPIVTELAHDAMSVEATSKVLQQELTQSSQLVQSTHSMHSEKLVIINMDGIAVANPRSTAKEMLFNDVQTSDDTTATIKGKKMNLAIALNDFLRLVYGNNNELNDSVRQTIRNTLGKDTLESITDIRAITMALDRQIFPTPMIVRFSTEDVKFALINGIECPVDRHDVSVSAPSASTGSYEPHLVACFGKICLPGSVVFDIGANMGYHSLLLSKMAGENGRVYAFEPNSENCRFILLASEHNRISNITLVPIALSDQRGWAHFSTHIGSNGGFVSQENVALHGHGTVVPTFTLDEMSLPNVDVIKIDVEGAEYKALKGGEALLLRSRPAIVCEFSISMVQSVSGGAPADFLNWIESMDYNIFVLDRDSLRPVPVDSISALFNCWGSLARIEDLLFLPREKNHLIEST